jgi:hypothetical protein
MYLTNTLIFSYLSDLGGIYRRPAGAHKRCYNITNDLPWLTSSLAWQSDS